MGRRYDIDWDAIERDYRLGQLTIREIAKQHQVTPGAICRRVEKHGWSQDLSNEVRARTNAALIRKTTPKTTPHSDVERAIDKAVRTNVEVVRQHRAYIRDALELAAIALATLKEKMTSKDELIAAVEEETKDDSYQNGKPDHRRRNAMLKALGIDNDVATLNTAIAALAKAIPLERQAFGIDKNETVDQADFFGALRAALKQRSIAPDEERNEAVPAIEPPRSSGTAITPDNDATFQ